MKNPESVAKKILERDPAFQWVVVLDAHGDTIAHVYSESYKDRIKVAKQTQERLGAVDTVFLAAAAGAEKWYGKMEFILLAYNKAKVMLMYSEKHDAYFAAKIPRSSMAEHLYPKVCSILGRDSAGVTRREAR
ncbi:MAG: hypothetical protein HY297_01835 [Thaumarchaeota archaeon]|nr:hypothetical protein [Nitrososphaerota archaeon]